MIYTERLGAAGCRADTDLTVCEGLTPSGPTAVRHKHLTTDGCGNLSDMSDSVSVPAQRSTEREIGIRELRNAGKVIAELAAAGAVGRVTSGGRLVGWVVPATPAEQRAEELAAQGKLRPARPGGLAGRRPRPRRTDVLPLSETLDHMRLEERG
jgi:hypothetical protein